MSDEQLTDPRAPSLRSRFLVLWSAGVLSVLLVLPYALSVRRSVLEALPPPLWAIATLSVLQSGLLMAIATFGGLRAADAVGLRTPLTNALAACARVRAALRTLGPGSAVAIAAVAAVIAALELLLFLPLTPEFQRQPRR